MVQQPRRERRRDSDRVVSHNHTTEYIVGCARFGMEGNGVVHSKIGVIVVRRIAGNVFKTVKETHKYTITAINRITERRLFFAVAAVTL